MPLKIAAGALSCGVTKSGQNVPYAGEPPALRKKVHLSRASPFPNAMNRLLSQGKSGECQDEYQKVHTSRTISRKKPVNDCESRR